MRLVQLIDRDGRRRIATADDNTLRFIDGASTIYGLAQSAIARGVPLKSAVALSGERFAYEEVYAGQAPWRLLPPIDHPDEAARCYITGTGLTHKASALNRNAMHEKSDAETDSMKMFRWGLEGGRPAPGQIGAAPEWFYKGNGSILRAHNEPLDSPPYAEDGGEEPEIAGVYLIDSTGTPRRLGLTQGNEFSDHKFEKRNYLYLAHSKLRACSLGPELVVDPDFTGNVEGKVSIERKGATLWSRGIQTGEANMCHTVANMEHHHFKYALHRRPGDVHVHYFGADGFSFGDGVVLAGGDIMQVSFAGFGRPLRNPLRVDTSAEKLVAVKQL
jgi:hypothetical protein